MASATRGITSSVPSPAPCRRSGLRTSVRMCECAYAQHDYLRGESEPALERAEGRRGALGADTLAHLPRVILVHFALLLFTPIRVCEAERKRTLGKA